MRSRRPPPRSWSSPAAPPCISKRSSRLNPRPTRVSLPGRVGPAWPVTVRTLVISDLHLGNRGRRDVLRRPQALERLLDALADVGRLVLLGDSAELLTRHPRRPLAAAEPVLRAIGERMGNGAGREIVLVPGNHD